MNQRSFVMQIPIVTIAALTTSARAQQQCKVWQGPTDSCVGGTNAGSPCTFQADCPGGTCEVTFGAWQHGPNWVGGVAPGPTDCVQIGPGMKVAVTACKVSGGPLDGKDCAGTPDSCTGGCVSAGPTDTFAQRLEIGVGARLDVNPGLTLTISPDPQDPGSRLSTLDGQLVIFQGGKLLIADDATIEGDLSSCPTCNTDDDCGGGSGTCNLETSHCDCGGSQSGNCTPCGEVLGAPKDGGGAPATIEVAAGASNPTLTIAGAGGVASNLVLRGMWSVNVALINDATVNATLVHPITGKGIVVSGAGTTGSGIWTVGQDGPDPGVLNVETPVTGTGTWIVDTTGTIRIDAASLKLTGDVQVRAGTFEIEQAFATTGTLSLGDPILNGGRITVADGVIARFDVGP